MASTQDGDVELLHRMVGIASPTGNTSQIAEFLAGWAREHGFRSMIDGAGNVIASTSEQPPEVMLVGHIDTVPGEVPVKLTEKSLSGRGAVDAKGPFATFLLASRHFIGGNARITVVGTPDEEGPSDGAAALIGRYKPNVVIIGEPSGWDTITIGYKGALRLELGAETTSRHPSRTEERNAIELLLDTVGKLRSTITGSVDPVAGIFSRPTITVREVRSADDGMRVTAAAKLDIRLPPGNAGDAYLALLAREPAAVTHRVVSRDPAVVTDKNTPLVRAFIKAIRAETGTPRFVKKTGTSDMNLLYPAWKVPMVAYGPGDPSLDHTPNEWIDIEEFRGGIRVLRRVLANLTAA